jgi:ADP-ribose pyrophosphatase YjhB (NUDIX family)
MTANPYYYIGENPTCDLIILNPEDKILLIKRSPLVRACPNLWALPGGFIDTDATQNTCWLAGKESPEQAAIRELQEETNLILPYDTQLLFVGIYEGNRDPRDNDISWAKSFAFFSKLDPNIFNQQKANIRGKDDAIEADWFSLEEINTIQLAFDHSIIIKDAQTLYFNEIIIKNKTLT